MRSGDVYMPLMMMGQSVPSQWYGLQSCNLKTQAVRTFLIWGDPRHSWEYRVHGTYIMGTWHMGTHHTGYMGGYMEPSGKDGVHGYMAHTGVLRWEW